jgi:hypothetical protein
MTAKGLRYCSIVSSSLIRTPMQPNDPFPIERCSPRLKTAILAEFNGRSPTYQDILSLSPKEWMSVPGMGPALLRELHRIVQNPSAVAEVDSFETREDADLMARLERFQEDLKRLQHDLRVLLGEAPSRKADANGSDAH